MANGDADDLDKSKQLIWGLFDKARAHSESWSLAAILEAALQQGSVISDILLRDVIAEAGIRSGMIVVPANVELFISDLVSNFSAKKVLDVWAGVGTLTRAVAAQKSVETATGITRVEEEFKIANLVRGNEKARFVLADPQVWLGSTQEKFDFVVGSLPFGLDRGEEDFQAPSGPVTIADDAQLRLLLRSVDKLSPDGKAAFIVPPRFCFERGARSVRANLEKFGVFLNGLIFLRPGTFAPVTKIGGYLALISKNATSKLFIAELSDIVDRNRVILKFFTSTTEGKDAALGRWVDVGDFHSWDNYRREAEIKAWLEKTGYASGRICDVAIEICTASAGRLFEDKPNSVYIPTLGTSDAVTSRLELQIKEQNYLQIVVDPTKIEPRFLASFFNSTMGRQVRSAFTSGTFIPKLTKSSISEAVIYFPAKAHQLEIVGAETKIKNLQNRLDELRSKLSDDPSAVGEIAASISALERQEDFEDWIEQLPFPLATILWHYHVRGEDSKSRYEQLFHFFEALTEFVATILISGFKSDASSYEKMKSDFRSFLREGSFQNSTFGTWNLVAEYLGAVGRKALKSWDPNDKKKEAPSELVAFKTKNRAFLEMIFSERLLDVLKRANGYRNLWLGHSGAVDEIEANQRRVELEALVSEARSAMGRGWVGFQMVRALSLRFSNGTYYSKIERLMGVRTPFVVSEVEAAEPLDDQKLYFIDKTVGRGLEIAPFIKVLASPRSAQNACYFYNRADGDGVRFVSYYFGSDAEIVDAFPETRQLIAELLPQ